MNTAPTKSRRGFASMDAKRRIEIARLGGQTAHREGRAHKFTSEEAREAGRLGGLARKANIDARKAAR
jgi:general stress protein YciG